MEQSDESDPAALPAYPEVTLAEMEPVDLIALMVHDEDRVPRNVIDACARHGEDMVAQLRRLVEDDRPWPDLDIRGEWWLVLHAVMILGLIPGEQAGLLLVRFMRRMAEDEDDDLQDWLAGWWPFFFRQQARQRPSRTTRPVQRPEPRLVHPRAGPGFRNRRGRACRRPGAR